MVLIDAHVHIYPCFNVGRLFQATYDNFRLKAEKLAINRSFVGVLLLAERKTESWFKDTFEKLQKEENYIIDTWTVAVIDSNTLKITGRNGEMMYIIAGRQFNCTEGLEVLSLTSRHMIDDSLTLSLLIENIKQHGGIAVIPWAFGKWFGKRGELLSSMLHDQSSCTFFLGDNGGRPIFLPSKILKRYRSDMRFPVLSGTDPLPLKGEEERIGSFGFYCDIHFNEKDIYNKVRKIITEGSIPIRPYGHEMATFSFLRNQILIRK